MTANAFRSGGKASQPSDFFASLKPDGSGGGGGRKQPARQSPELMLAMFQMITGAKVQ